MRKPYCGKWVERELFLENILSDRLYEDEDNDKLVHFLVKRIRKLERGMIN